MNRSFGPESDPLVGEVAVPGDKSLSHRAVLFSAMAEGMSTVHGVLDSADVRSTIDAVRALGAGVDLQLAPDGSLSGEIDGWGAYGPMAPDGPIDCGNSGTTARLLMGVLAGWPITVALTGDESLSRRPMRRVTEPLTAMGARFDTTEGGTLPVTVHGSASLTPFAYDSPVASAQVKTALLLAGTRAAGGVKVTEPALSRDHTERLLPAFGVPVTVDTDARSAALCGPVVPQATEIDVPRDPSSAAFLIAAALLVEGSEVTLRGVSLNPTRVGFLRVLVRMGGRVELLDQKTAGTEPVGTLKARYTPVLTATTVTAEEVPSLVDEVPVLALVAARARGTTRFEGVGELRVKESDRLQAIADGLLRLGVEVRSGDDWLEVDGVARLEGATLDALHDHRLAMVWAIAGLIADSPVTVEGYEAVEVSYPHFAEDIAALAAAGAEEAGRE
jgi:3-phosphoshikimate 1-carboxyvinyltransferase